MTSNRTLTLLWTLTAGLWLAASSAFAADETPRVRRIGYLTLAGDVPNGIFRQVREQLRALGYVDGTNAVFETRFAQGQAERLPELAAQLVQAKVDVIVANQLRSAFAAKGATTTVPIVVWGAHDAVGRGLIQSLTSGGNITGVESLAPELDAKRIQLIRELVPALKTLGLLYDADDPGTPSHLSVAQSGAKTLNIGLAKLPLRSAADFDAPFSSAATQRVDGLLIFTSVLTFTNFSRVAEFAHSQRLPTICEFAQLAEAGCLMSYGPTFAEFNERVAHQVDRILKGARPTDLPYEQPTRYELVVNLKTAKAIGVTVPQLILLRATRVIE